MSQPNMEVETGSGAEEEGILDEEKPTLDTPEQGVYENPIIPEVNVEEVDEDEARGRRRERKSRRESRKDKKTRRDKGKEKEKEKEEDEEAEPAYNSTPLIDDVLAPEPATSLRNRGASRAPVRNAQPLGSSSPNAYSEKGGFPRIGVPDLSRWTIKADPKLKFLLAVLVIVLFLVSLALYGAIVVVLHFNEFQPESRAELPVLMTLNVANVPKFHKRILAEMRPLRLLVDPVTGGGTVGASNSIRRGCASLDEDGNCDEWGFDQNDADADSAVAVPTQAQAIPSVYEGVNLNITSIPWHTPPITDEFTLVTQFVPGEANTEGKFKNRRVSTDTLMSIMEVQFAGPVAQRRRQQFNRHNHLSKAEETAMDENLDKDIIAYNQRLRDEKKKAFAKLDAMDPFERNLARDDMANKQAQKERDGTAQGSRCICSEMVGCVSRFTFSCLSDEDLSNANDGSAQCRLFIDPELEPSWDLVTESSYRTGCFTQEPEWRATLESLAHSLQLESQPDGSCPAVLGRNVQTRVSYSDSPALSEMFWFYGPKAYTPLHLELHMFKEKVTYERERAAGSTIVRLTKAMQNRITSGQRTSRIRLQDRIAYRYDLIQAREAQMHEAMANASHLMEMEQERAKAQSRLGVPAQGFVDTAGTALANLALDGPMKARSMECLKDIGLQKRLALDSINQTAFFKESPQCIEKDFAPPVLQRKVEVMSGHHLACVAQCYRISKVIAAEVLEARETNAAALREIRKLLEELRGRGALRAIYTAPQGVGKVGSR